MSNFERRKSDEGTHRIYNLVILDESGSMSSLRKETLQGLESVFASIREGMEKFPEQEHRISLISFSSANSDSAGNHIKQILWNEPANKIPADYSRGYKPNGGTPLYDAIGFSLNKLQSEVKNLSKDGYNVLVTIITDGEENASREYDFHQIKKMIESCSEGPWTFAFIGAGLEAYQVARNLSIRNAMAFRADKAGVASLFEKTRTANIEYMACLSIPQDRENLKINFFKNDEEESDKSTS